MSSYTTSETNSFTIINARYLASKVVTDLQRCAQIYGSPSESAIERYKEELTLLIKEGFISEYEFGFQKDDSRIVCWKYVMQNGELVTGDDRPGKIYRKADIDGASFYNFLTYSQKWVNSSDADKATFAEASPVSRSDGQLPSDGAGYWQSDKNYSSGGQGIARKTFIPL